MFLFKFKSELIPFGNKNAANNFQFKTYTIRLELVSLDSYFSSDQNHKSMQDEYSVDRLYLP